MSQFEAASLFPTIASQTVPSYPSYLPLITERPSRAPHSFNPAARSTRRPSTHPATNVPPHARLGKLKKSAASADELLKLYTPVVQKIVGGFQRKLPRNVLREDLMAAGMIGLWDAIQRHGEQADEGFEWYVRVRVR